MAVRSWIHLSSSLTAVASAVAELRCASSQVFIAASSLSASARLPANRVMYQRAPFDHPELPIPAGQDATGKDIVTTMPAVGAGGSAAALPRYLGLNPFQP